MPCDFSLRLVGGGSSRFRSVVRLPFDSGLLDQSRHRMKRPGAARTEKAFEINAPSAIARSVAACCACSAGCVAMIAWEAAAGPTAPPVRASEARPLATRRRSLAAASHCNSRANATSIVGRDFRPNHTEQRAIAAPHAFNGLCDDEGVPLICPTCQVLTPQSVLAGARLLLCMGLFSIFLLGATATRRGCENPA